MPSYEDNQTVLVRLNRAICLKSVDMLSRIIEAESFFGKTAWLVGVYSDNCDLLSQAANSAQYNYV